MCAFILFFKKNKANEICIGSGWFKIFLCLPSSVIREPWRSALIHPSVPSLSVPFLESKHWILDSFPFPEEGLVNFFPEWDVMEKATFPQATEVTKNSLQWPKHSPPPNLENDPEVNERMKPFHGQGTVRSEMREETKNCEWHERCLPACLPVAEPDLCTF